jgi:hypothetical protein
MGTFRSKKKAETRMNAGLRPNQGVKVRVSGCTNPRTFAAEYLTNAKGHSMLSLQGKARIEPRARPLPTLFTRLRTSRVHSAVIRTPLTRPTARLSLNATIVAGNTNTTSLEPTRFGENHFAAQRQRSATSALLDRKCGESA